MYSVLHKRIVGIILCSEIKELWLMNLKAGTRYDDNESYAQGIVAVILKQPGENTVVSMYVCIRARRTHLSKV